MKKCEFTIFKNATDWRHIAMDWRHSAVDEVLHTSAYLAYEPLEHRGRDKAPERYETEADRDQKA